MLSLMTELRRVPLSVLDIVPVQKTSSPTDALRVTSSLARRAEKLNFTRFWVAEHHNAENIASSSPAVILSALGAVTDRIRIGSGGVMLPNHPPLVVAEQFGTLAALYPGRVDLGIGRAPGTDPITAGALRRLPVEEFAGEFENLLGFLSGEFPEGHPYRTVAAVPTADTAPAVWMLGSSSNSARTAGRLGLPFAYANHFNADGTLEAVAAYRESFRPSDRLSEPYLIVSLQVVCAETDEHARYLADPAVLSVLKTRHTPFTEPYPSPEDAAAHVWTEEERAWADARQAAQAVGGPDKVRARLAEFIEKTQLNELMITNSVTDESEKLQSLERVRGMFGDELPQGIAW